MTNTITWKIKPFDTLSLQELYSILKLRSLVFVVEQNCVYQDIDDKDQKAMHLLGYSNAKIVAYARLFNAGDYFNDASIGRVIVHPEERQNKYGHQLMQQAITAINTYFNQTKIAISAQLYLKNFYEAHQFFPTSEMYLEDNIPHIAMIRE